MKNLWLCVMLVFGSTLCLQLTGCAWMLDAILESAFEQEYRDGRADDRDGLTDRDRVARFEEARIREFDAAERSRQWQRINSQPTPAQNENRAWQDFLLRDRDGDKDDSLFPGDK